VISPKVMLHEELVATPKCSCRSAFDNVAERSWTVRLTIH
jgi:hypothetical protein